MDPVKNRLYSSLLLITHAALYIFCFAMVTSFGSGIFRSEKDAATAERCALTLLNNNDPDQQHVESVLVQYGIRTRQHCAAVARSIGIVRAPKEIDRAMKGKLFLFWTLSEKE